MLIQLLFLFAGELVEIMLKKFQIFAAEEHQIHFVRKIMHVLSFAVFNYLGVGQIGKL